MMKLISVLLLFSLSVNASTLITCEHPGPFGPGLATKLQLSVKNNKLIIEKSFLENNELGVTIVKRPIPYQKNMITWQESNSSFQLNYQSNEGNFVFFGSRYNSTHAEGIANISINLFESNTPIANAINTKFALDSWHCVYNREILGQ